MKNGMAISVYLLMKMKNASNRVLKDRKSSNITKIAVEPASEIPIGTPTKSKAKRVSARASMNWPPKAPPVAG